MKISFRVGDEKLFLALVSIITPGARFKDVLTDIGMGQLTLTIASTTTKSTGIHIIV